MLLPSGLYEEIRLCRAACGDAHMKTILATGELGSFANVYKASMIAMMAGKYPWFSFEDKNVFAILFIRFKKFWSWKFGFADVEKICVAITAGAGGVMKCHLFCVTYQKLHEMLSKELQNGKGCRNK